MIKHAAGRLQKTLENYPALLLAFSGGMDSSLLLAAARKYGVKVLAVQCVGPLCPPWEMERAPVLARALGAELLQVDAAELAQPSIAANGRLRCYYCKYHKMTLLLALARERGWPVVADGSQTDDLREARPGNKALKELGIKSPLQEAGLNKDDVRAIAAAWKLPAIPPSACLATRIPLHTPLRADVLLRIGQAENCLRPCFSGILRLRDFFPQAVLEVEENELLRARSLQEELLRRIAASGYAKLEITVYNKPRKT